MGSCWRPYSVRTCTLLTDMNASIHQYCLSRLAYFENCWVKPLEFLTVSYVFFFYFPLFNIKCYVDITHIKSTYFLRVIIKANIEILAILNFVSLVAKVCKKNGHQNTNLFIVFFLTKLYSASNHFRNLTQLPFGFTAWKENLPSLPLFFSLSLSSRLFIVTNKLHVIHIVIDHLPRTMTKNFRPLWRSVKKDNNTLEEFGANIYQLVKSLRFSMAQD